MRASAATAVVVLTVVLAGCFGGPGTEVEPTSTTASSPTATATPTATPGPFGGADLPPGVGSSGVTDVDALLSAHSGALNGSSATVSITFHLRSNDTTQNASLDGKYLPGGDKGYMEVEFDDGRGAYYTVDGTTYYREVVNGSVSYGKTSDVSAVPERPRFGADERVRTAVSAAEWEPVGTVERDGRTLLEFRATSVDPPNVNSSGDTTVKSSGRLLVDSRGVVHLVSVSTTVENQFGSVEYALRVAITDVGSTTVEEPSWMENAEGAAVR